MTSCPRSAAVHTHQGIVMPGQFRLGLGPQPHAQRRPRAPAGCRAVPPMPHNVVRTRRCHAGRTAHGVRRLLSSNNIVCRGGSSGAVNVAATRMSVDGRRNPQPLQLESHQLEQMPRRGRRLKQATTCKAVAVGRAGRARPRHNSAGIPAARPPARHAFNIAATRPINCSTAASIVSRRAVGYSADQRAANRGARRADRHRLVQPPNGLIQPPQQRRRQNAKKTPRAAAPPTGRSASNPIRPAAARVSSGSRKASSGKGSEKGRGSPAGIIMKGEEGRGKGEVFAALPLGRFGEAEFPIAVFRLAAAGTAAQLPFAPRALAFV